MFISNTTDGSRWIRSDPTYPGHHKYPLRAGEFKLSGGLNVRSPAPQLLSQRSRS